MTYEYLFLKKYTLIKISAGRLMGPSEYLTVTFITSRLNFLNHSTDFIKTWLECLPIHELQNLLKNVAAVQGRIWWLACVAFGRLLLVRPKVCR